MSDFYTGQRVQYSETGPVITLRNMCGTVRKITHNGWIEVDFDGYPIGEIRCAPCNLFPVNLSPIKP